MKTQHRMTFWLIAIAAALGAICTLLLGAGAGVAQSSVATASVDPSVLVSGYAATAAATIVSTLSAAYAVARVGTAAVGVLAEKPELFGRMVVLVGLAEGIAIYGLIVAILLLAELP